jgi:hypothetical protein
MNERIRELAEQARVQDRGYFIYQYGGPTGHQSVEKAIDLEKFAELIIRKCAKVADLADETKCEWIGGNILTHFGVKE